MSRAGVGPKVRGTSPTRAIELAYIGTNMEKLKEFQVIARQHGFIDVEETEDGTVLWLRRPTTNAEDRMCIDSVTNSVTVFWATIPWKINSKTFRVAPALEEWFTSTSAPRDPLGLVES